MFNSRRVYFCIALSLTVKARCKYKKVKKALVVSKALWWNLGMSRRLCFPLIYSEAICMRFSLEWCFRMAQNRKVSSSEKGLLRVKRLLIWVRWRVKRSTHLLLLIAVNPGFRAHSTALPLFDEWSQLMARYHGVNCAAAPHGSLTRSALFIHQVIKWDRARVRTLATGAGGAPQLIHGSASCRDC